MVKMGQVQLLTPVIPAPWEAKVVDHLRSGDRDQPGQHSETPSLLKIQNSARCSGVNLFPSYSGAEAGESLEPGRWRLQRAEIMPLYSSLGDKARTRLKKQNKKMVKMVNSIQ